MSLSHFQSGRNCYSLVHSRLNPQQLRRWQFLIRTTLTHMKLARSSCNARYTPLSFLWACVSKYPYFFELRRFFEPYTVRIAGQTFSLYLNYNDALRIVTEHLASTASGILRHVCSRGDSTAPPTSGPIHHLHRLRTQDAGGEQVRHHSTLRHPTAQPSSRPSCTTTAPARAARSYYQSRR